MMDRGKNLAFVLFVVSATLILGSTTNAYATDTGDRGTTGSGDLEACLNDKASPPCDTAAEWDAQNISAESLYTEGESIPVRVDITGLDTNAGFQELIVEWDITKKQGGVIKHTFDYITSFDRNDKDADPCFDFPSGCFGGSSSFFIIPPPMANTNDDTAFGLSQPVKSFTSLPEDDRKFWMFALDGTVTIKHVTYVSEGDPSAGVQNDQTTKLSVIFTTTSSDVIAAFGAHISSPADWDNTASDVNGSPYRVGCVEIKVAGNGGCKGSFNIDANDLVRLSVGQLTLKKTVINDNGGNNFADDWTLNATGVGGFSGTGTPPNELMATRPNSCAGITTWT